MHELMALFSEMIPMESVIDEIKTTISNWEKDRTEENMRKIVLWTAMLNTKHIISSAPGGVREVIKQMDEIKKMKDLITRTDL